MEISKPSISSHRDIITDSCITETVNDSDSYEFEVSDEESNE
jgi:hypothetical protein